MIRQAAFPAEPWSVRETSLSLEHLAQAESLFALGNGHLGLRGNLDEGEPFGLPGTYLGGFCELRPLPTPESAYGNPTATQTIVNVTNGKLIRLLVDDEPLDVRYGKLRSHERVLDLRAGVLQRSVDWVSPTGRAVRVRTTRLVSFTQRAIACILYEVEPLEERLPLVVQSELVANEPLPDPGDDPRAGAAPSTSLRSELAEIDEHYAVLVHATERSKLRLAAAMDHEIDAPAKVEIRRENDAQLARLVIASELEQGQTLRVVKYLAYGWSAQRTTAALRDQVAAALAGARRTGWQGLLDEQRTYLDDFWERADVELDGDAGLQQAVRFGLFHVLQASARGERRAIAAKGLTGPGYDGHTFWDTETFVLPVLIYTATQAAGDALRWRHRTLGLARERARELALAGATFPWRTIDGRECSGYWPAGTAAFHINADVADAVVRYLAASGDDAFEREAGVELLVETARLWRSLGHHDKHGRFRIDGVTGPDEYSALADNNVYTNLMAQRNLDAAAAAIERNPELAATLGVDHEESAAWRDAAKAMLIPYDEALGVHPQDEAFTEQAVWDFDAMGPEQYPLLLHYPYFQLYRKQVVKQADLVLAMHLRGDAFSAAQKARNFAYYEPLTVRDSSLSACTQAVLATEVGHLDLAYAYFSEAALMDLDDIEHNTRDGVHIASLAGTWIAAVAGLGGMRDHDGALSFAPRLPEKLTRLAFRLCFGGCRLLVEVRHREASYTLVEGEALAIAHHGKPAKLTPGKALVRVIPHAAHVQAPQQPHGRAPNARESTQ
jgi:alpha,alpha-trehalose phosphorylase